VGFAVVDDEFEVSGWRPLDDLKFQDQIGIRWIADHFEPARGLEPCAKLVVSSIRSATEVEGGGASVGYKYLLGRDYGLRHGTSRRGDGLLGESGDG
jgi:hypothetical protein